LLFLAESAGWIGEVGWNLGSRDGRVRYDEEEGAEAARARSAVRMDCSRERRRGDGWGTKVTDEGRRCEGRSNVVREEGEGETVTEEDCDDEEAMLLVGSGAVLMMLEEEDCEGGAIYCWEVEGEGGKRLRRNAKGVEPLEGGDEVGGGEESELDSNKASSSVMAGTMLDSRGGNESLDAWGYRSSNDWRRGWFRVLRSAVCFPG
jgi:hypothetical protein